MPPASRKNTAQELQDFTSVGLSDAKAGGEPCETFAKAAFSHSSIHIGAASKAHAQSMPMSVGIDSGLINAPDPT